MMNTINTTATNNNGFLAAMGHVCDVVANADINLCRGIGFCKGYTKAWIRDHEPQSVMDHMTKRDLAGAEGAIMGATYYFAKKEGLV